MQMETQIDIAAIEARLFEAPIAAPVRTSFGTMRSRPAVLVRVLDSQGMEGWGEVWCNFPSVGAQHRARLIRETVAPLLVGRRFHTPEQAWRSASSALEVLAIQSGEPGPIAQVLAGVDMALWDLAARHAAQPLYRYLGARAVSRLPVYASGLNPDRPEELGAAKWAEGHRAFKLKVGFGRDRDLANLQALRATLADDADLMVDANQAWDLQTALQMSGAIAGYRLLWLEEPIRADAPAQDWLRLAQQSPVPLAAGENMRGFEPFEAAMAQKSLAVLQPDIGKWGGFSACVPMGRQAVAAGLRLCPHWLGGGIGLIASLHLLASVGGAGLLEVDSNPNPLRELMATPFPEIADGRMQMTQGPGLGVAPDLDGLREFEIALAL